MLFRYDSLASRYYDLGYEFPGDKKNWSEYVREKVFGIIIEWDKKLSKDDSRLFYLKNCLNLCKQKSEDYWDLDDEEDKVTQL